MSHVLFGKYFAIFTKLIIILGSLASLTAYMGAVAASLAKFVRQFVSDPNSPFVDPKVLLAFALIVIIPMCLSKRISWLTWSSFVSILPLFYLLVLEVVYFGIKTNHGELKGQEVPLARGGVFVALPIFVFAYSSQTGAIPIFKARPILTLDALLMLERSGTRDKVRSEQIAHGEDLARCRKCCIPILRYCWYFWVTGLPNRYPTEHYDLDGSRCGC